MPRNMAAMDVSQDYDSDNSSIIGDSEGDCDISSSDSGNEVPSESSGDDSVFFKAGTPVHCTVFPTCVYRLSPLESKIFAANKLRLWT